MARPVPLVLCAAAISLFATETLAFAFGVWTYRQSGSALAYGLVLAAAALPGVLMAPWIGRCVHAGNAGSAMVLALGCGAISAATAFGLVWSGRLGMWGVYLLEGSMSACLCLQTVAQQVILKNAVPSARLARINGLGQAMFASAQMLAPAIAGLLLTRLGMAGVALTGALAAFLTALVFAIAFDRAHAIGAVPRLPRAVTRDAWRFIRSDARLRGLLATFAVQNFLLGAVLVLITPVVLGRHNEGDLGQLLSWIGLGFAAGGAVAAGVRQRVAGPLLGTGLTMGLAFVAAGTADGFAGLCAAAVLAAACIAAFDTIDLTTWQRHVDASRLAGCLAVRHAVLSVTTPIAGLTCGIIVDGWLGPQMDHGGVLVPILGPWIGSGPGRGAALLMVLAGMVCIGCVVWVWRAGLLRGLDRPGVGALDAGIDKRAA